LDKTRELFKDLLPYKFLKFRFNGASVTPPPYKFVRRPCRNRLPWGIIPRDKETAYGMVFIPIFMKICQHYNIFMVEFGTNTHLANSVTITVR